MNNPRVVATYTTLPSRYDILKQSILSLREQTHKLDAIYLAIPQRATRLNKDYPPIPDDLSNICTIIKSDNDYGPLTKLYGALISETNNNTIIISCDDDVIFKPKHIEILLQHHKDDPKSSICGTGALIGNGLHFISIVSTVEPFHKWNWLTGFNINKNGRKIDLVFGVAGVLYTRGMFPNNDKLYDDFLQYSLVDQDIFCNDDVLISGFLNKQGIDRKIFIDIPTIRHIDTKDALSYDIFKMIRRLNSSIYKVKELGFFPTMEIVTFNETPAGKIIIALILSVLIIILSICFYKIL